MHTVATPGDVAGVVVKSGADIQARGVGQPTLDYAPEPAIQQPLQPLADVAEVPEWVHPPFDASKDSSSIAPALSLVDTTLGKRDIEIGSGTQRVDNLASTGYQLLEPPTQETLQHVYGFVNPAEQPIQETPQDAYSVTSEPQPQAIDELNQLVIKKLEHGSDNQGIDPNNTTFNLFIGVTQIALGMVDIEKSPFAGGAFGEVYQGSWGNRPVALKKIDVEYAQKKLGLGVAKDDILESLGWEIARLSTVSHPNLVQFHGIYQHKREDYTYLVMEFCEGGELRKELKKKEVGYPGPNVFNGPWN